MPKRIATLALFITTALASMIGVKGQQPTVLSQVNEASPPATMSSAELTELGDPFFRFVLSGIPLPDTLTAIEQRLTTGSEGQQTFVVSEQIASVEPGQRRMVLAFTGSHAGKPLTGNVMLSVFFDSNSFDEARSPIEVVA